MKIAPEKTILLNLPRRTDRRDSFYREVEAVADWPFAIPRCYSGVDGAALPDMPEAWKQTDLTKGAYACTQSYARIMEDAFSSGCENVLVFEDDCFFVDPKTWGNRTREFLDAVPDDWDAIYLGGNHRNANSFPPVIVNDLVLRAYMLTATHAFIMRRSFMEAVYPRLHALPPVICDLTMARIMKQQQMKIYTPHKWLCGQRAMGSDIASGFTKDSTFDLLSHKKPRPVGDNLYERYIPCR